MNFVATLARSQRKAHFARFDDHASSKNSKIRANNNGKLANTGMKYVISTDFVVFICLYACRFRELYSEQQSLTNS